MTWLLIVGFAVSSSLDNLGAGISYGIRRIRVGVLSNLIIAMICFTFSESGILFGQWLSEVLPGILPVLISAFIMMVIGLRIVLLAIPRKQSTPPEEKEDQSDASSLKDLLQHPEKADKDKSGSIGVGESVVLGIALSANAVTNGLSAGLMGLSPLAISLTAAQGSFITIWIGVVIGRKVAGVRIGSFTLGQFGTLISGVILLMIACNSLFD
ncbi:sporulation membrane protein YtaF [Paenibacillus elgii]|uniref:Sporulation membrane protein YtaF n=1 Tax=Paenibacillus elgii TaxID=189691 RepID=A0A2T6FYU5_9BACL|nr:sporulation membrane protein YtaF [Paenibacillus elgii]MCM3270218.1 sporulation membrane protein YtaF [Paenibacillus elgii]NEN83105.1 sporulation membrane protein YtaF [Paenibacillus elgii]PUA37089.1 sporulation membrane protein YtaF [Paenibacillus elgii]